MADTMRAVDIENGAGPASALFINDSIPKPSPKAGEVLVKVKAFGLNRADTLQRMGNYPVPPGASKTLGLEFSGTVSAINTEERADGTSAAKDKHAWKEGDEVLGLTYGGAYAEFVVVDARMLIRKPEKLGWEEAAGVCEAWFTALQALHVVGGYEPSRVKSVVWHAGASSVSIAGIQLSQHAVDHFHGHKQTKGDGKGEGEVKAPKVFATTRNDDKNRWLESEFGINGAVNPTAVPEGKWADKIKEMNGGEGVDLVIDYVGASYFQENINVLAKDGRIVCLGLMGGTKLPEGTDISGFLMKRARFEGSTLRSRDPKYQGHLRDLFEEKCLEGLTDGSLKWDLEKVMSWKDIAKAHELMESNKTKGKIVCVVD